MNIVSLRSPFGLGLALFAILVLFYLLAPLGIVIASSFGSTGFLAFPPHGFSLRWYGEALSSGGYIPGFLVSLRVAAITTVLSLALGVPAAYGLVRYPFRGSRVLESLSLSPLMLPALVLAVALTMFFAKAGIFNGTWRLVFAQLTICIPCVLRIVIPTFERLDRAIEEAALNLGAHPMTAFFLVSMPSVRPGLLAAAGLAFIMSFDEVDMAVFLASPRARPLTVVLYSNAQDALTPSLAAVGACLIGAVFVLMLIQQLVIPRR